MQGSATGLGDVSHLTLAADLISELQVGQSRLQRPPVVVYDAPFRRTVNPTSIPNTRDDIVNGSFGFKLVPHTNITLLANALFPLNRRGLGSSPSAPPRG